MTLRVMCYGKDNWEWEAIYGIHYTSGVATSPKDAFEQARAWLAAMEAEHYQI